MLCARSRHGGSRLQLTDIHSTFGSYNVTFNMVRDGCISVTCHIGTRHSVTPVERTRDPPSAVLAVRGPGRRTGMRYALCGNTPTRRRGHAYGITARYRSTEILV